MKNENIQPKYTKGELRTTHYEATQVTGSTPNSRDYQLSIIVNGIGLVAMAHGATKEEAEANAKRLITAINSYDERESLLKEILFEISDGVTHMNWDRVQELSRKIQSVLNIQE